MESQEQVKPAYWAVLPAAVRYDPELSPSAKLLYAELSALANFKGYCYALNSFFETNLEISERTVRRLIEELRSKGYISVYFEEDPAIGSGQVRKIYCGINPLFGADMTVNGVQIPPAKNDRPPGQKCPPPPAKNDRQNNININNIPPITPLKGGSKKMKAKTLEHWKPERFEKFWAFYPRKTNKKAAQRAWDKLKASDELLAEIGTKLAILKASPGWADRQYIPHASTFLNGARWNDVEDLVAGNNGSTAPSASGWAEDPEVI